ncbi:hypothetical protein P3549_24315, partial [Vibrio parahaemolyticus]|nr:hypothetical protein [Vibrio parahaemolyticus]
LMIGVHFGAPFLVRVKHTQFRWFYFNRGIANHKICVCICRDGSKVPEQGTAACGYMNMI